MNVLSQNLLSRVTIICVLTAALSLGFYFLEYTHWAETIREAASVPQPESDEPRGERAFILILIGSMLKATILIGVPLSITLLINRLRKKFA